MNNLYYVNHRGAPIEYQTEEGKIFLEMIECALGWVIIDLVFDTMAIIRDGDNITIPGIEQELETQWGNHYPWNEHRRKNYATAIYEEAIKWDRENEE